MEDRDLGTLEPPRVLPDNRKYPIFAGYTDRNQKIVLYVQGAIFHLRIPDGSVHALGPDSDFELQQTPADETRRLFVRSKPWTGEAFGSRRDTIKEESFV